ncbi:MaoC/PaaZ C-terminal domain-containing protein [Desulfovirgula thermocuniculi]|uniref:MaoC/PaaZ C-terminal domain-containing protein n=1 Tax=Desulfovirgula thermocuniculi TaxID=348842 RepID=UPI00041D9F8D|nr:MaoC/PaaZ C-terminal domain-containing protein [Desulfovirgula thermocuniculi]
MLDRYYDELEVGTTWHSSRGRTITEADIVMFAALSGDWYPLHTDKEWAGKTRFGQRIAHGLLVLSICSGMWPIKPGAVVAFYGIEKLRFTAPTFIGDTIYVKLEVLGKEDRGAGQGVVTLQLEATNQRQETVIAATLKILMNKRPA